MDESEHPRPGGWEDRQRRERVAQGQCQPQPRSHLGAVQHPQPIWVPSEGGTAISSGRSQGGWLLCIENSGLQGELQDKARHCPLAHTPLSLRVCPPPIMVPRRDATGVPNSPGLPMPWEASQWVEQASFPYS